MAKKTALKKKATVVKSPAKGATKTVAKTKIVKKEKLKAVKPTKSTKTAKVVKAVVKPAGKAVKTEKAIKPDRPALMTAKGKKTSVVEAAVETSVEKPVAKKQQTIVSMMETAPLTEEAAKAEKISKVKPVKVERGNLADEKAKWVELNKKYGKDKALTYKMTELYPSLTPLQHKVLGWGFILTNENDRLEVLFENGIRMLISNYKN